LSARSPAAFADRRRAFYGALLLAPPLLWLGIVYLGSLFTLLMQSFYAIDEFTARVVPEFTLETYRQLVSQPANVDILVRTLLMAVAVTIAAGIVAFPIANFMARHAGPRMKAFFYVGVMLPMWTSSGQGLRRRLILARRASRRGHSPPLASTARSTGCSASP
jgi:putative spermidine/putrescine transport system permease protein